MRSLRVILFCELGYLVALAIGTPMPQPTNGPPTLVITSPLGTAREVQHQSQKNSPTWSELLTDKEANPIPVYDVFATKQKVRKRKIKHRGSILGLSTAKEDERLLTEGDEQDRQLLNDAREVLPEIRNRASSTKAKKGPSFVPMWNKKPIGEQKYSGLDFKEPSDWDQKVIPPSTRALGPIPNFREPDVGRKLGETDGMEYDGWSKARRRATSFKVDPLLGIREPDVRRGMNELNLREPIVGRNEVIAPIRKPYLRELDRLYRPAAGKPDNEVYDVKSFPYGAVLGLAQDSVPSYRYSREERERREREQREKAERRIIPNPNEHIALFEEVKVPHENPSMKTKKTGNKFSIFPEELPQETIRENRRHSYVPLADEVSPNLLRRIFDSPTKDTQLPKRQKNPKGLTVDTNGGFAGIEHRAALKNMIREKFPPIIKSGAPSRKTSIQSPTKIVLDPLEKQALSRQPLPFKSGGSTRQNAGTGAAHVGTNSFSSMEQFLAPASFYNFLEPRGQVDLSRIPVVGDDAQGEAAEELRLDNKSGRSKYLVPDNISFEAKEIDTKRLGHGRSKSGATMDQLTKGGKVNSKFVAKEEFGRGPQNMFEPL